jgi:nitroreductase
MYYGILLCSRRKIPTDAEIIPIMNLSRGSMSMEFTEVISRRRAVRHYKNDPIPQEVMTRLYEALRLAPSGNNRQPYRFYFVTDAAKRREIVTKACHQKFILEAPVIMAATCERDDAFNVAIAVDHLILAAANEGLGTCWV